MERRTPIRASNSCNVRQLRKPSPLICVVEQALLLANRYGSRCVAIALTAGDSVVCNCTSPPLSNAPIVIQYRQTANCGIKGAGKFC